MTLALLELPQAVPTGVDLTRYVLVCLGSIVALLGGAWLFKRFLAERLRARAAQRSLQVLDVLPLGGKQRLMVVRCYERSFLLGVGDKEVRSIAELEPAEAPLAATSAPTAPARPARVTGTTFASTLAGELTTPVAPRTGPDPRGGFLA